MTLIDTETKHKLREMGATALADALASQDDTLTIVMPFAERIKLAVDDAHASVSQQKIEGLIRRAGLRYPDAELRRLDLLEERHIDRGVIAQLGTCTFISRSQNVVFQGFTGSGKTYLGSALAKAACQHRYRALYIRMPDPEEAWHAAADKPGGKEKFSRKYSAYQLLVIDEWLLDRPDDSLRGMLSNFSSAATTPSRRCSARSISRKTGMNDSAVTCMPTPSWTASCIARSG